MFAPGFDMGSITAELTRSTPTEQFDLFDSDMVAALAELEGQLGLNLKAQRDEAGAEDHYRSALYFAELAQDWGAVSTWGVIGSMITWQRAW